MEDQYTSNQTPPPVPQQESYTDDIPPLKPNNWLWQSIVATILCCNILGVIGVVYAAKVDTLYHNFKYEEAEKAAKNARTWTLVAIALGLVYIISWSAMLISGDFMSTFESLMEGGASGYNF